MANEQNAGEDLIPKAVVHSILKSFPAEEAVQVLRDLEYSPMNGCYFFHRWGMVVGVEFDGHIHS